MKSGLRSRIQRRNTLLAFGAELASCRYRLTLARYVSLGEFIRGEAQRVGQPLKLLDVACGEGRLILYGPFPTVEFTGVDVRPSSLETAHQRGYARLLQADVTEGLPFADESFDIVVCSHVLEHVPEPRNLISEVDRVLRPGGMLMVGVPMCLWWTRLLRIYVVPLLIAGKRAEFLTAVRGHVQFFTMGSLKRLLRGFVFEDIRGFRFFSAGRYLPLENWHWYYRLNTAWGRLFPRLTSEINIVARKPAGVLACVRTWNRVQADNSRDATRQVAS